MAWDDQKDPEDLIRSNEWDNMVTDQKGHASRHESSGVDSIDHDLLLNYIANEHIDHSTVNISAGTHLTGGGDITSSRTLNVDETSIDATNLDGSSGTSGEFLTTDGTSLSFTTPPKGMTKAERQAFNDVVTQLARNDFEDNLDSLGYDGGFYDIFADQSKIASSTDISFSTLEGGDPNGKAELADNINIDDFEDGDIDGWTGATSNLSAQQTTVLSGQYSGKLTTNNDLLTVDSPSAGGVTDNLSVEIQIEDLVSGDFVRMGIYSDTDTRLGILRFNGDNTTDWFDGSFTSIGYNWTANEKINVTLEIDYVNDNVEIFINDSSQGVQNPENNIDNTDYIDLSLDTTGSATEKSVYIDNIYVAASLYSSNGSFTTVTKDLSTESNGGLTDLNSWVVSQDADILANTDIQYTVRDENSNEVTATQTDVDTEVDISSLTGTTIEIDADFTSDGSDTPTLYDHSHHFQQ